jgi:hypothetical protein
MTAPAESLTNPESWALSDCAKTFVDAHKHTNNPMSNARCLERKQLENSVVCGLLRLFIVGASGDVRLSIFFILPQKISKRIMHSAIKTRTNSL